MTKPLWETTYADIEAKSFGDVSQEIFDLTPMLPSRAKILDLGCGDGRNAIPLARAGFDVTAIDLSQAGIHKLNILAGQENLSIQTAIADITTFLSPQIFEIMRFVIITPPSSKVNLRLGCPSVPYFYVR